MSPPQVWFSLHPVHSVNRNSLITNVPTSPHSLFKPPVSLSSKSLMFGRLRSICKSCRIESLGLFHWVFVGNFSFDTPRLVYFFYSAFAAKDYPIVKMENLLEARIMLFLTVHQIELARASNNDWVEDDEDVLRLTNVGKLVKGIRNVQYLNLSTNILGVLSLCCESMPVFNNLKSLTIMSDENQGWQAMPVLLRNCPHLETLVLEINAGMLVTVFLERTKVVHSHLVLEIKGFQGTMKETHMIRHFLDFFPCLKEIKIYTKESDPTELRVPEISEVITEMMEHYNKLWSCNVQLLVNGYMYKKWTAQ